MRKQPARLLLSPIAPPESEKAKAPALIVLASFYLGLALALPVHVNFETGFISSALLVSLLLAFVGWRYMPRFSRLGRYEALAFSFTAWFAISAVAVWRADPLYRSAILGLWLLFIVPGLAGLWTEKSVRRAFIVGVTVGIVVYGVVAAIRLASGEPVRDVGISGQVETTMLGMPRNAVNLRAVLILPFLLAWDPGQRRVLVRWVGLIFVSLWLVTSGGRSGIVGAAVGLVLYSIVRPGVSRRLQAAGVAFILALTAFFAIQQVGGPAAESTNRLVEFIRGERTSSDDIRELATRKAWHAGVDNPLFGLGPRTLAGYFHPIILEGDVQPRVMGAAVRVNAHNTYAEVLAQSGFPGALGFLTLLVFVFSLGVRGSRDSDVRVATAGMGGVLTILYFNSALSLSLFYALALVLAASMASPSPVSPRRETS